MRTPFPRREAGSLTNRPVTIRTKRRFKHPRTGSTALLLSTTTELFIVDLIAQHDPEANPQLARHRHASFAKPLLHEFAAIEALQVRITARRMSTALAPEKPQQGTALFGHCAEPLVLAAGVFSRDQADVTGQCFAIREPLWITQEDVRG